MNITPTYLFKIYLALVLCFYCNIESVRAQSTSVHSLMNQLKSAKTIEEKIELNYNIAQSYYFAGNDSLENKYYKIGILLSKKNKKPALEAKGLYYLAEKFYLLSINDSASYYAQMCINLYEKNNLKTNLYVGALNIMASASLDNAEGEEAMKLIEKQLDIAREINDSAGISTAYTLMAALYETNNSKEDALKYTIKALELDRKIHNQPNLAQSIFNVALIYLEQNDAHAALPLLKEGLYTATYKYPSERDQCLAHLYLGNCYQQLGKKDSSTYFLNLSHQLIPTLDDPDITYRLYESLAKNSLESHQLDSALIFINKAISTTMAFGLLEHLSHGLKLKSTILADLGNYKEAYTQYINYVNLNDSLSNLKLQKSLAALRVKHNMTQKDEKIARQKQIFTYLTIGSLLLLILLIIIFIQYVRQKKTSNIIRHQALDLNILMKELHHRVKNNLQIISSLMSLQSFKIKDNKASQAIRDSQQRIEAMSLIHQKLYTNQNITEINIKEFITDLVDNLKSTYCDESVDIKLNLKVDNETLNVDKAIPLSLIINELVSNVSKHAFKNNSNPLLTIDLTLANNIIELVVADNGEGINIEDWDSKEDSFGKELIKTFVKQLKGFLHVDIEGGTQFTLYFPKDNKHK